MQIWHHGSSGVSVEPKTPLKCRHCYNDMLSLLTGYIILASPTFAFFPHVREIASHKDAIQWCTCVSFQSFVGLPVDLVPDVIVAQHPSQGNLLAFVLATLIHLVTTLPTASFSVHGRLLLFLFGVASLFNKGSVSKHWFLAHC